MLAVFRFFNGDVGLGSLLAFTGIFMLLPWPRFGRTNHDDTTLLGNEIPKHKFGRNPEVVVDSEEPFEASTEFDDDDFKPFLEQIVPIFKSGFDDHDIQILDDVARRMRHNQEKTYNYEVGFEGKLVPLIVRLFKDDIESIGVYFFSSEESLIESINQSMGVFMEERGL